MTCQGRGSFKWGSALFLRPHGFHSTLELLPVAPPSCRREAIPSLARPGHTPRRVHALLATSHTCPLISYHAPPTPVQSSAQPSPAPWSKALPCLPLWVLRAPPPVLPGTSRDDPWAPLLSWLRATKAWGMLLSALRGWRPV